MDLSVRLVARRWLGGLVAAFLMALALLACGQDEPLARSAPVTEAPVGEGVFSRYGPTVFPTATLWPTDTPSPSATPVLPTATPVPTVTPLGYLSAPTVTPAPTVAPVVPATVDAVDGGEGLETVFSTPTPTVTPEPPKLGDYLDGANVTHLVRLPESGEFDFDWDHNEVKDFPVRTARLVLYALRFDFDEDAPVFEEQVLARCVQIVPGGREESIFQEYLDVDLGPGRSNALAIVLGNEKPGFWESSTYYCEAWDSGDRAMGRLSFRMR